MPNATVYALNKANNANNTDNVEEELIRHSSIKISKANNRIIPVYSDTPDDIDIDFMLCIINYKRYISGSYKEWTHCIIAIDWNKKEINYYGYTGYTNKEQKTQDEHTTVYFEKVGSYMFPNAHIKFKINTNKNDITLNNKHIDVLNSKEADPKNVKLINKNAKSFLSQLNEKHITSVCNLSIDGTFIKYIIDIGLVKDETEFKNLLVKLQTSYFEPIDSWQNGKFTLEKFNKLHIIENAITDIINPEKLNLAIKDNTLCKNIILQPCQPQSLDKLAQIKIPFSHKKNKREITIDLCKPSDNTGGSNTFKLADLDGVKYGIRYSFLLYLENTIDLYNALIELIKTSIISHKFMNIKTHNSNGDVNSTFIPNVHEICKIGFIKVKLKGTDLIELQCETVGIKKDTYYNFYIPYIITINSDTQAISKYIDSKLIESVSNNSTTVSSSNETSSSDKNADNFNIEEFIFRLLINIILYLLYAYIELNCIHSDFKLNNIVMNTENNDIYIIDFESLSIYFNYDGQIYYLCQLLILDNNVIDIYNYKSYLHRFILRHTYVDTDIYYVLSSLIDIGTVNKDTIKQSAKDNTNENAETLEQLKIGQTIQKYIKMQEYLFTIFSKCKLLLLCFEASASSLNDNSNFITDLYCFLNDAIKIKTINYNTVNLLFYILHNLYTSLSSIEKEKKNKNASFFDNIKILRPKNTDAESVLLYLSLSEFFNNKNNKIMCYNNDAINNDVAKPGNSIITYPTDTLIKDTLKAMELTFIGFAGAKPLKYKSDCSNKSNLLYIFSENIKSITQITSSEQQSASGGGKNARIHKYTIKNQFQSKTKKNNKTSKTKLYTNNKNNTSKNYAKHRSIINKLTKQKHKRTYKHTHKH